MNLNKKISILLSISSLFIFLLISISLTSIGFNYYSLETDNQETESLNQEKVPELKKAYFNNDADPIYIDDLGSHDWTWAESQQWLFGFGTEEDPFRIENLTIDASGSEYGIKIENSLLCRQ